MTMDQELKQYLEGMEARIDAKIAKCSTKEDLERIETNLLKAFYNWARPMEVRVSGITNTVHGFDERLALMEQRVSELERRRAS